jgi:hypothetical protein
LPDVPSVRNPEAWKPAATPEQAADAVTAVEVMTPARMDDESISELVQMVARRDYSEAELAYATREMMYDQELTKELTSYREEPTLYPSDFHRFVEEIREMRRQLECVIDRHEMNRLIQEFDLSRSDFGVAGYTVKDKPLFRFKQDPGTADGEVRPKIDENPRPGADREQSESGGEPVQIGEAIGDVSSPNVPNDAQ